MQPSKLVKQELEDLRSQIAQIEGRPALLDNNASSFRNRNNKNVEKDSILPFGYAPLDRALDNGLPSNMLTEFRCDETRAIGSASAFVWILAHLMQAQFRNLNPSLGITPIIWIGDSVSRLEGGSIYPRGLLSLGIDPSHCLFVHPRSLHDAVWAAELAAKQRFIAATIMEVRGNPDYLDMAGTRRLHLRAQAAGRPFFLLRQAGHPEATAAPFRFHIGSVEASACLLPSGQVLPNSPGRPAFDVTLEKSRLPAPSSFILEWNHDTYSFAFRPQDADGSGTFVPKEQTPHFSAGLSLSKHGPDQAETMGRVVAFG